MGWVGLAAEDFDLITSYESDSCCKPNPQYFLSICERLGVKPEEFLYLGDMSVDIVCAKNAGMHSVGVTWGFGTAESLHEAGAEYVIDHPAELLNIL